MGVFGIWRLIYRGNLADKLWWLCKGVCEGEREREGEHNIMKYFNLKSNNNKNLPITHCGLMI